MGRKLLALVPAQSEPPVALERFHADATEHPLFTVVTWSARVRSGKDSSDAVRKRQLAIASGGRQLLELQRVQAPEGSRSWFVGNDVHQDGSVLLFSPIDPLFVLLSCVWEQRTRFMAVDDLLAQLHNSWLLQLEAVLTQARVELVCDVQPTDSDSFGTLYIKASEAKIDKWLRQKVERVARVLIEQEQTARATDNGAFDANFQLPGAATTSVETKQISAADLSQQIARRYRDAIDMIGDYLPGEWAERLYTAFNVKEVEPETKTPAKIESTPLDDIKRFDRRRGENTSAKRTTPSNGNGSASKKKSKLANVDRSGMKSLTSFFGKK